jgi:hypothetical protein
MGAGKNVAFRNLKRDKDLCKFVTLPDRPGAHGNAHWSMTPHFNSRHQPSLEPSHE